MPMTDALPTPDDNSFLQFELTIERSLALEWPSDMLEPWTARLYWPAWGEDEIDFIAATASGWRFRWYEGPGVDGRRYHPQAVLDSLSADSATYMRLFDDGDLHETLLDGMAVPLIIADRVTTEREMRGHRYGPLLLGLSLAELNEDTGAVAACEPSPFLLQNASDDVQQAEQARLERIWAQFGFERWDDEAVVGDPFEDGEVVVTPSPVWTMDLSLRSFEEMLIRLRKEVLGG